MLLKKYCSLLLLTLFSFNIFAAEKIKDIPVTVAEGREEAKKGEQKKKQELKDSKKYVKK